MKFKSNDFRAEFVVDDNDNPLQIAVPDGDIEGFELTEDQIKNLIAAGFDKALLEQEVREPKALAGEITRKIGGLHEGALNGKRSFTQRFLVKLYDGTSVETTVSVPEGARFPELFDTVEIRNYPQAGVYFNRAGRSRDRSSTVTFCLKGGNTPLKVTNIGETSESEMRKELLKEQINAVRSTATSLRTNATAEA